jgi:hypothetical protein
MGTVLFCVAGVVAAIRLAAILLIIRDRLLGTPPVTFEDPAPGEPPVKPVSLLLWRRILAIPFAILVGPPLELVVAILFTPLLVAQVGFLASHWPRFRLYGVPLPQIGLPEDAFFGPPDVKPPA